MIANMLPLDKFRLGAGSYPFHVAAVQNGLMSLQLFKNVLLAIACLGPTRRPKSVNQR
jgi:hypothetical protein